MKKLLFLSALIFGLATIVSAQMKEGKIVYERKINMWKMITDPEMRTRIPEFRTSQFELLFNDQASLFRTVPDDEAPDPFANNGGDRGGGQRFMFRMPESAIYTNLTSQVQFESRAMFEKTFLIIDTLKMLKWKVSEETKTIAKHLCKKATTSAPMQALNIRMGGGRQGGGAGRNNADSASRAPIVTKETEVTVWYTEEIPASVGPDNYFGLPGAILEVDMDNGNTVTTAKEISTKYPKKELVEPTKGDKMNRAQFQDNMKKIMEDMQRSGGGFRVRRDN
jgi:GLPGLI family protein